MSPATGPELRIGDAERERAAGQLAEHYAVGRITQEEHTERLDRIWAARTASDLAPVFADLPGHPAPTPRTAPASRPGPVGRTRRGPRLPVPLLVVLGVLAVAVVVANPMLVLIGVGVWFFFLRGGCGSRSWGHHPRRW